MFTHKKRLVNHKAVFLGVVMFSGSYLVLKGVKVGLAIRAMQGGLKSFMSGGLILAGYRGNFEKQLKR